MSKKCRAYSESKLGLEPTDNRKAFYAGWDAALAQQEEPVQEPVAWIQPNHLQKARVAPFLCRVEPTQRCADFVPFYLSPPQRKPLTKEEIMRAFYAAEKTPMSIRHGLSVVESARIVERAHGIKE